MGDKLRAIGVVNTHDLLRRFGEKGKDIACSYRTAEPRMVRAQHAIVWSPSHKTNPEKAAWYDYGNKSFLGNRGESLPKAMAWASEKYGITEWVTCPTDRSTKIPKAARDAALRALKSARPEGA